MAKNSRRDRENVASLLRINIRPGYEFPLNTSTARNDVERINTGVIMNMTMNPKFLVANSV